MKKIFFLIFVFVSVFVIYYFNIDKKVYYASIGDYLSYGINSYNVVNNSYSNIIKKEKNITNYINYSFCDDYRVMDLIRDINNNKEIVYDNKTYKIQNILIKANYITMSIGMNDLIYKEKIKSSITYQYMDELLSDIEHLFKLLRKYNKDEIFFLSFYNIINNEELINYGNLRLKDLAKKYNIQYINIEKLNNFFIESDYPTDSGYLYISEKILNFTKC